LARYLGPWDWQWRNEHGEPMRAHAVVEADATGAFLIDRTAEFEDGKLVPSELNLYFWDPLAKAVASLGFTSTGDHGQSFVSFRDDLWIEQSGGWDGDGALRTHVDLWQWADRNHGVYQETHVVHAGRVEPDDFKLSYSRADASSAGETKVADGAALADHFKPIARLVGRWKVEWTDGKGTAHTARSSVQVEMGGAALTEKFQEVEEGKVVLSEFTVFYWQAESRSLATVTLASDGRVWKATLYPRVEAWVAQTSARDPQGRLETFLFSRQWKGDDSFGARKSQLCVAGEEKPDPPARSYTRLR
jgi:hypothetical protein